MAGIVIFNYHLKTFWFYRAKQNKLTFVWRYLHFTLSLQNIHPCRIKLFIVYNSEQFTSRTYNNTNY